MEAVTINRMGSQEDSHPRGFTAASFFIWFVLHLLFALMADWLPKYFEYRSAAPLIASGPVGLGVAKMYGWIAGQHYNWMPLPYFASLLFLGPLANAWIFHGLVRRMSEHWTRNAALTLAFLLSFGIGIVTYLA